ncbi:excinuclease ABC subunit C [bacterium (Candidatus Gribaldobacteria) CG_4_10_14_0_2_um_filter_41_16]|uniref:Excinuclease ABC subunit C n=3 Tax=Candidatus Gribaldobacteria TaxID=2798536 RepID=A0A2M7VHP2_9BACT|nr:MAG: excinuclease ABC subunit C [Parcubacteria group bacterium CG1_02_41_26]PIV46929.1 MAG: excinuclease ABC subunit C [bacterium (Candidatus Gribaldobacteria) CG02_land_8_20_14_3_00_41_15]PIX03452.1 MAG: excinuclease ABC subunit C [bacterium (Candidatus Gribaldobacteria) CG_4_8_14_3_um_filter_42_11]PJA01361.1 MAG: excinuclease ABC subunit C [bacterium (Candidatus Gribaldobacteria) CG_4_10_14_0_2_um_filter_41_16]
MYYTYIIKSLRDNHIYAGHTNNLKKRFNQHNQGLIASTKNRRPFKLLYYEACNIIDDAIRREKMLKTGFGRAYLKRRLNDI